MIGGLSPVIETNSEKGEAIQELGARVIVLQRVLSE